MLKVKQVLSIEWNDISMIFLIISIRMGNLLHSCLKTIRKGKAMVLSRERKGF